MTGSLDTYHRGDLAIDKSRFEAFETDPISGGAYREAPRRGVSPDNS